MATTKTATAIIGTDHSTKQSIAASGSASGTRDVSTALGLLLTVDPNFHASAINGVKMEVFTSDDGTNWDDVAFMEETWGPSPDPGQKSFRVPTEIKHIKVTITNQDTGQAVDVTVWVIELAAS